MDEKPFCFEDWEAVLRATVPPKLQGGYREAIVKFRYWLRQTCKEPDVEAFKAHLEWKQSYLPPERFEIRRAALRWYYQCAAPSMPCDAGRTRRPASKSSARSAACCRTAARSPSNWLRSTTVPSPPVTAMKTSPTGLAGVAPPGTAMPAVARQRSGSARSDVRSRALFTYSNRFFAGRTSYKALSSLTMAEVSVDALSNRNSAAVKKSPASAFRYFAAMRQYSGSISIPMLFLPLRKAATMVVPDPQKGSRTVSPSACPQALWSRWSPPAFT